MARQAKDRAMCGPDLGAPRLRTARRPPPPARFAALDGVVRAWPSAPGSRGNDIDATPVPGGWTLHYSVAWGDCIGGLCDHRHTWTFDVRDDGTVTFLGSDGPPPPAR